MKIDELIDRYVRLRDLVAQKKAAYEAEIAKYKTGMERVEAAIMTEINAQGVESVRTEFGTAFKSTSTSVTAADGELFMQFCIANDRFDLMEKRPSKIAVEEYKAANDDLPPGINYRQSVTLNVRRA